MYQILTCHMDFVHMVGKDGVEPSINIGNARMVAWLCRLPVRKPPIGRGLIFLIPEPLCAADTEDS